MTVVLQSRFMAAPQLSQRLWTPAVVNEPLLQGSAFSLALQGGTLAAPNLAQDPQGGTLAFNPATSQQTPPGGYSQGLPPGITLNTSTGVVQGTPTSPGNYAYTINASNNTALADWNARLATPGLVRAQRFTSAADVNKYRYSNGIGYDPTPAPGSIGSNVYFVSNDGVIGDGAMRQDQLSTGNMNTVWWMPFDPALVDGNSLNQENPSAIGFGPGQGFYMQIAIKGNQYGNNNSQGGEGRKMFSVSRTRMTDTDQEIVTVDQFYRGVYSAYQGYGIMASTTGWLQHNPIATGPLAGADFNLQPGSTYAVSPAYCSYQQVNMGNKANCWVIQNNVWVHYLIYVLPSHYQTADGHYTVWAWTHGMPDYAMVIDVPNFAMQYGEDGVHTGVDNLNAMVAWIYDTGSAGVTSPTSQWYDQILIGTQFIPHPAY